MFNPENVTTAAEPTTALARVQLALPPLQGVCSPTYDGRYRLYTVDHLPFDALPAYSDGGPAMVAVGEWCVSYVVDHSTDWACTLKVYRAAGAAGTADEHHPLYGATYTDIRDAERAAYEAGALAFAVYERDASRWDLPSEMDDQA